MHAAGRSVGGSAWLVHAGRVLWRSRSTWGPLLCFVLLLAVFWPVEQVPRAGGDTHEYLSATCVGRRLPVYRWVLGLTGITYSLVVFQFVAHMAAWSVLGWAAGKTPGMLISALLATAKPVYQWCFLAYSEGLSFSLIALVLGLTILLLKGWKGWLCAAWVMASALMLFIRETNLFLLPFLALPFFLRPRRQWITMWALVLTLGTAKYLYSTKYMYYQATQIRKMIVSHSMANPDTLRYFVSRGMPDDWVEAYHRGSKWKRRALTGSQSPVAAWSREHGASAYLNYILTPPKFYAESWQALKHCRHSHRFLKHARYQTLAFTTRSMTKLYYYFGLIPLVVWLACILLPALSWLLTRRVTCLSAIAASMVPMIYMQAFFSFAGDFYFETARHLLTATLFYRVNLLLGMLALLELVRLRRHAQDPSSARSAQ